MGDLKAGYAQLDLLVGLGYRRFIPVQQSSIPGTRISARDLCGRSFDYVFPPHASGPFGEGLPNRWLTYDDCIAEYKRITWKDRVAGHQAPWRNVPRVARTAQKILGAAGWHDLHARLD